MDRPLAGLYVLAGKRNEKEKWNEEVDRFFTLKISLGQYPVRECEEGGG